LQTELVGINRQLELAGIDRELHDVYASRQEHYEVKELHGYATLMWTNNARVALSQRQNVLVAVIVAESVVDDILDWMYEGWYFGETKSGILNRMCVEIHDVC
jgi:hypothetical protein